MALDRALGEHEPRGDVAVRQGLRHEVGDLVLTGRQPVPCPRERGPDGAYTAFAAAAPRFPIPEAADPAHHLSTLFPPVRPRGGYLEVRYVDAQPPHRMGAAIAVVTTLLTDARARRDALDLLLPHAGSFATAWDAAAEGFHPDSDPLLAIANAAQAHELLAVGGTR